MIILAITVHPSINPPQGDDDFSIQPKDSGSMYPKQILSKARSENFARHDKHSISLVLSIRSQDLQPRAEHDNHEPKIGGHIQGKLPTSSP